MIQTPAAVYAARRQAFMAQMQGGAALIPTSPPRIRTRDTDYRFRPDSDFYYLTGFKEPGAVLLLIPGHAEHQAIAFVQPKDALAETWHGRRLGVDAAPAALGVDVAYSIDELEALLPKYLLGAEPLYYGMGEYAEMDALVLRLLPKFGNRHVQPPSTLISPASILHEMRLRKDASEADLMRRAAEITAEGYANALAAITPGGHEYEIQGAIEGTYRRLGAEGPAYNSIVAAGENALILHYTENDQQLRDGELLLIDSGAEYGFYACDVTRTYPINGRFTPAQRTIYDLVLKAQEAAIAKVTLGHHVKSYHETSIAVLTDGLIELGLLKGDRDALIASEACKPFSLHGTGHYLGLDTHDVGRYMEHNNGPWRALEVGMVVTVEPGLYIPHGTPGIDPSFWGIGIRIEDDVMVTETGNEVLTRDIAKQPADVEALMAGKALVART